MPVIFLVGPTGVGKTRLSMSLAKKINAEIISCDSMCVYKGMDILTSKPSIVDRRRLPHHLIDIIPPEEDFSVARYRELALEAISEIQKRKKTPLFVGGSGLYVNAVVYGLFPSKPKDERYRKRLYKLAKKFGSLYLYKRLKKIDPVSTKKIHPNDLRRIVRALEIFHLERVPPSILRGKSVPLSDKYDVLVYGLNMERLRLYERIDRRVEEMFEKGIVEEVERLSKKKLSQTAGQALGYKEIKGYLDGRYSIEEAKALLKKNTRHYAKRQLTWFRRDKRILWFRVLDDRNLMGVEKEILSQFKVGTTI